MESSLYLVVVADDRFAAPLGVTLTSIFENTTGPIDVTVVLDNVSQADQDRLRKLAEQYEHRLKMIEPEFRENYKNAKSNQWVTKAAYYRLHMAEFLPPEAKKAIYIDTDILCTSDLRRLWNEPLDGQPVGAVTDPTLFEKSDLGYEYDLIGTRPEDGYFNSGVMVADLEQWRKENVAEKILEHIIAHPKFGRFHDQSRLNAYFARRWKSLPLRYNLQARMMGIQLPGLAPTDPKLLAATLADPVLVHFNGPVKPWQGRMFNPFKADYQKVLRNSLWRDWHPKENKLKEFRWFFGDFRRNWRQYQWCKRARTSVVPVEYAVTQPHRAEERELEESGRR